MQHYIYKITNTKNGKYYIGYHCGELDDDYYGSGIAITRAVKKHGKEHFKKEILVIATNMVAALFLEKAYIGDLWQDKLCYNMKPGGKGGSVPGSTHSDETKAKMSETRKGRVSPNKGKIRSEESKRMVSEKLKGRVMSDETKAKMSDWQKGKPKSEDARQKMCEAQQHRRKREAEQHI